MAQVPNKQVKFGDLTFDSKAEFRLWQYLESIKGNLIVGRPFKVDLLPSTRYFNAKHMLIDFWIGHSEKDPHLLIEYKGEWVKDGRANMSLLNTRLHIMQMNAPIWFGKLVIVGDLSLGLPNMVTLTQLENKIKGFQS